MGMLEDDLTEFPPKYPRATDEIKVDTVKHGSAALRKRKADQIREALIACAHDEIDWPARNALRCVAERADEAVLLKLGRMLK